MLREAISKGGQQGVGKLPSTIKPLGQATPLTNWAWVTARSTSQSSMKAWYDGLSTRGCKEWWTLNLSEQEIVADSGVRLPPGAMVRCSMGDREGWSGEHNRNMTIAAIWQEKEKSKRTGRKLLRAANMEGLSNQKMQTLDTWCRTQASDSFAIALSEVRRHTGRRKIGQFQAHWSLDQERHAGVGLLLSAEATSQRIGEMQELVKGRILKARFLGDQGVWILLAVYAPQSTDAAALQQFWQAINKEVRQATQPSSGPPTPILIIGDMNATPEEGGRDGRATRGDKALRRTME
eukprot:gene13006-biopygen7980